MASLIFCAFLHAFLYSGELLSMDEVDEDAAKILDKSCAKGGSITVVDGAT